MGGRFYNVLYTDIVESACTCYVKERRVHNASGSQRGRLEDKSQLYCGPTHLSSWYNVTEKYFFTGINGRWDGYFEKPIMDKIRFPQVVLGYVEDKTGKYNGGYVWTIETACIEKRGVQVYNSFNVFHREWNPPAEDVKKIRAVFEKIGLGSYWKGIKPMDDTY